MANVVVTSSGVATISVTPSVAPPSVSATSASVRTVNVTKTSSPVQITLASASTVTISPTASPAVSVTQSVPAPITVTGVVPGPKGDQGDPGPAGSVDSVTGTAPISVSTGVDPVVSLDDSGVTAGDYTNANITVDAKGRITAASDGAEDTGDVLLEVKNNTGATIPKGTPVYVNGTFGGSGKPTIDLADSNGSGTYPAIGLTNTDIADEGEGKYVTAAGTITGIDTSSYYVGDALYLSDTAGGLVKVRPSGSTNKVQKVALVSRVHPSNGSVIVMGAGRTNDIPNITTNYFWLGNGAGVATAVDFDTEVSANTDVTDNTSHRTGSVTDHSDVTSVGSGAIITTDERSKLAGIDENANAYVHPDHTGEVTSTADGATVITDDVVDEANLKVSNAPVDGYVLTARSGNTGGLTWEAASASESERTSDLTVYIPDSVVSKIASPSTATASEVASKLNDLIDANFLFGKLKHNLTINASAQNPKTALEIIQEVLFAYTDHNKATLATEPVSDQPADGDANDTLTFRTTLTNANYAAPVKATVTLETKKVGVDSDFSTAATLVTDSTDQNPTLADTDITIDFTNNDTTEFQVRAKTVYKDSSDAVLETTFSGAGDNGTPLSFTRQLASAPTPTIDNGTPTASGFITTYSTANGNVDFVVGSDNPNHEFGTTIDIRARYRFKESGGSYGAWTNLTAVTGLTGSSIASQTFTVPIDQRTGRTYEIEGQSRQQNPTGYTFVTGSDLDYQSTNAVEFAPVYNTASPGTVTLAGVDAPADYDAPSESVTFTATVSNANSVYGAVADITIQEDTTSSFTSPTTVGSTSQNETGASPTHAETHTVETHTLDEDKFYRAIVQFQQNDGSTNIGSQQNSSTLTYSSVTVAHAAPTISVPDSVENDPIVSGITVTGDCTNANGPLIGTTVSLRLWLSTKLNSDSNWSNWVAQGTATTPVSTANSDQLSESRNHNFTNVYAYRYKVVATYTDTDSPANVVTKDSSIVERYANITSFPVISNYDSSIDILPYEDTSESVTFTASVTNPNSANGVTITGQIQEQVRGTSTWTNKGASQTEVGATMSFSQPVTVTVASNGTSNKRYRLQVTTNVKRDNDEFNVSDNDAIKFWYRDYVAPVIRNEDNTNAFDRVHISDSNTATSFVNNSTREFADANSVLRFRVLRPKTRDYDYNEVYVDLDTIYVYKKRGTNVSNWSPLTELPLTGWDGVLMSSKGSESGEYWNPTTAPSDEDDANATLGTDYIYVIRVWDDKNQWTNNSSTVAAQKSTQFKIRKARTKLVLSTSAYLGSITTQNAQDLYDISTANKTHDELESFDDDFLDTSSDHLDTLLGGGVSGVTISFDTGNTEYSYFFVPSICFNWADGSGIDISGAAGTNDEITFRVDGGQGDFVLSDRTNQSDFEFGNGANNTTNNTAAATHLIIASDIDVASNPDSSETMKYMIFRSKTVQGSAENTNAYRIKNTS